MHPTRMKSCLVNRPKSCRITDKTAHTQPHTRRTQNIRHAHNSARRRISLDFLGLNLDLYTIAHGLGRLLPVHERLHP